MTMKSQEYNLWFIFAKHFGVSDRSIANLANRESESLYLLTNGLPILGKALDRAISRGVFDMPQGSPFRARRLTALPLFLYEKFSLIFTDLGTLKEEVNSKDIAQLRQLLYLFYKFEVPSTESKDLEAIQGFVDRDNRVKELDFPITDTMVERFQRLLPEDPFDIRPHHSSGATADRKSHLERRQEVRYIEPLMSTYDISYFFYNYEHFCAKDIVRANPSSRLALVPKDSRGPRVICIEPHEYMKIQKGLQTLIYDHIENRSIARGQINFVNQDVNRDLAKYASITGRYATIDLKDASDMVSWSLISSLLNKDWYMALNATRTAEIELPDGKWTLKKFAPMGSALCFPIEAMLFWTIAREHAPICYVYGDDIIVPYEYADDVIKALESFGLLVNHDKTLIHGSFKESCGGEYFAGSDISYVKCKSYSPDRFIAFANLVGEKHGLDLSDDIVSYYENKISAAPVYVEPYELRQDAEPLVYYTNKREFFDPTKFKYKWDENLHRVLVKRLAAETQVPTYELSGYDGLDNWVTESDSSVTPWTSYYDRLYNEDFTPPQISLIPDVGNKEMFAHGHQKMTYGYRWEPVGYLLG